MKTLTKYAVQVHNNAQMRKAVRFFQLASHRQVSRWNRKFPYTRFVGMGALTLPTDVKSARPFVTTGEFTYVDETVVPFENINVLADTPNRRKAYKKVFGK